ncbi:protein kinase [Geodermatophilus sp. SYSU D00691]
MDDPRHTGPISGGPPAVPGVSGAVPLRRTGWGVVHRGTLTADGRPVDATVSDAPLSGGTADAFGVAVALLRVAGPHPALPPLLAGGLTPDRHGYLVVPASTGVDLRQWIRERGPLPVRDAVTVAVAVAGALGAAHARGLVHGAVGPDAVRLDGGPAGPTAVRLEDFAVLPATADTPEAGARLDERLDYQAPELFYDDRPTTAADVFALGSTLFLALTGRGPFTAGDGMSAAMRRLLADPVPDLRREGVPGPVAEAVEQLTAKRPEARPTAGRAEQLLRQLLAPPAAPAGTTREVRLPALPPPPTTASAPVPAAAAAPPAAPPPVPPPVPTGPTWGAAPPSFPMPVPPMPPVPAAPPRRTGRVVAVVASAVLAVVLAVALVAYVALQDDGPATGTAAATTTATSTAATPTERTTTPRATTSRSTSTSTSAAPLPADPALQGRWAGTGTLTACDGFSNACPPTLPLDMSITCQATQCTLAAVAGYNPAALLGDPAGYRSRGTVPIGLSPTCDGRPLFADWTVTFTRQGETLVGTYTELTRQSFDCGPTTQAWAFTLGRA